MTADELNALGVIAGVIAAILLIMVLQTVKDRKL